MANNVNTPFVCNYETVKERNKTNGKDEQRKENSDAKRCNQL